MFVLAVGGWVIFRAPSLKVAAQVYYAMASLGAVIGIAAVLPLLLVLLAIIVFTMLAPPTGELRIRFTAPWAGIVAVLLAWAILSVGSGNSPFLYYQF
jgi:hypothetical protein